VSVNVVVALHWHICGIEVGAATVVSARSGVKRATQQSVGEVVGSTMLGEFLVGRHAMERRICTRTAGRLAELGIAVRSCRIRAVAVPPEVQDSDVIRVLEELKQILLGHRATGVRSA